MDCNCENGLIENTCPICFGSGEGGYDGSTCWNCKGSGVVREICTDCEAGAEAYLFEKDPLDYL